MRMDFEVDEYGPEKVVFVQDTKIGMKGFLIIDNTKRGHGKGGVRMSENLEFSTIKKLSRTMTLKNALADLKFGGAKGGIIYDPKSKNREKIIRAYVRSLRHLIPSEYIFGLDMGLTEKDAALVVDELGSRNCSTGKPKELGGVPYDELGITGFGIVESAEIAANFRGLKFKDVKISIQGFGAVGKAVAKFADEKGAKVVCVSDSRGVIYNENGLDIKKLLAIKQKRKSVITYKYGKRLKSGDEITVNVDIFIPSAKQNTVNLKQARKIKASIIVEGANFPIPADAQKVIRKRKITYVPDIVANAGGSIAAYAEFKRKSIKFAFSQTKNTIRKNTKNVLSIAKRRKKSTRDIAVELAYKKLK